MNRELRPWANASPQRHPSATDSVLCPVKPQDPRAPGRPSRWAILSPASLLSGCVSVSIPETLNNRS